MRTIRRSLPIVTIAALAAIAAGCAAEGGEAEPVDGGTLVYATGDAEPDCLDPHVGGNYPQALISTQYLEPLVGRDEDGTILPWLAEDWDTSEDGLTWDFTLRDDVTFTDGTPFDAEAVKVNVEHLQDPDTASSTGYLAVEQVDEVEVVDDAHVRFHLSTPKSALLEVLSQQWAAMQAPSGIERGQEENCQAPIGTGPFVVDSWTPQDRVVLTRNDDYVSTNPQADHDGAAHVETIQWRFIPDAATRQAALASGEVHVIDNPLPTDIVAAEGQDISHLDAPRPAAANRIELNSSQAPFDDIRVREAFIRSADPAPGIESLFHGTAERSSSVLSSAEPMGISDEELFATDVDRANELLDEAGWTDTDDDGIRMKDGEPLTVRFPVSTNQSTEAEQSLFEQIQANAAGVGFDVQLSPMDLSSWYEALGEHEYEAVSAPYTTVGPDVLRILYHSDGTVPAPSGYFANHAMLRDDELDGLLEEALATTDDAERADLYADAQRIILDSFTVLPLYDQQNHFLYAGVTGVEPLHTISTPLLLNAQLTAE
ncbi:ABC transporter substrate-binding protein [Microbacterium sp. JB110]|uniref:ABC transporter substrate-binding protein n=1 Tax=Microbacterium sp. JB110 TaxID=2024477 RepID=UPI00097ED8C0|nr:ABC transporter substrate-binding protein [Microbacterium sp. JB110]RCS62192.1 ABC transporter substrate-binding protein [Microbacterium sp. JB110]SJM54099.1 Oligopeptide ABC transporter, periplasmic oligopeptide-binding protein OppA (TC 3.A.1.5.1) [Frigoribacterium sp. JB110]